MRFGVHRYLGRTVPTLRPDNQTCRFFGLCFVRGYKPKLQPRNDKLGLIQGFRALKASVSPTGQANSPNSLTGHFDRPDGAIVIMSGKCLVNHRKNTLISQNHARAPAEGIL